MGVQAAAPAFQQATQGELNKLAVTLPNGEKRLVVEVREYYDVQAYVVTGVELPSSNDAFKAKYPQASFKMLDDIDSGIWADTSKTFVSVSTSCLKYRDNKMRRLWQLPDSIIITSRETIYNLKERPKAFQEQWSILNNPKYDDASKFDDDFLRAKKMAVALLGKITSAYKQQKAEVDEIINDLWLFANETKDNQKLVNSLVTRFDQPVTKDGKTHFSKTAYLNAEVAGLQSAMQKALKEQQDKAHSKGEFETLDNVYKWNGMGGLVGRHFFTQPMIRDLEKAYNEKVAEFESSDASKKEALALITIIGQLQTQFRGLTEKMTAALQAMERLQTHFNNQIVNFSTVQARLGDTNSGLDWEDFDLRQMDVDTGIDQAVKVLNEIQASAMNFLDKSQMKVSNS